MISPPSTMPVTGVLVCANAGRYPIRLIMKIKNKKSCFRINHELTRPDELNGRFEIPAVKSMQGGLRGGPPPGRSDS
nr:hypothetical protein [Burkholderia thailandensis]